MEQLVDLQCQQEPAFAEAIEAAPKDSDERHELTQLAYSSVCAILAQQASCRVSEQQFTMGMDTRYAQLVQRLLSSQKRVGIRGGFFELGFSSGTLLQAVAEQGYTVGGLEVVESTVFDTVAVKVPGRAGDVVAAALNGGINLRHIDDSTVGISCDETTTDDEVDVVLSALEIDRVEAKSPIPSGLQRTSEFMTHPVFSMYRSETEMMRYLRRLADFDIGLDRSMIPLGSCTMKLNAATEMIPITWIGSNGSRSRRCQPIQIGPATQANRISTRT